MSNINESTDLIAMIENHSDMCWNGIIDKLCKVQLLPFYEAKVKEVYIGYGSDYGWPEDFSKILDDALIAEGITSFEFIE